MDAWVEGLKNKEMNLFKPGYFGGGEIHFGL